MKNYLLICTLSIVLLSCQKESTKPLSKKDVDFDKAELLMQSNPDSAFFYFNKVATSSKDSLNIAYAYNFMSVIQSDAGDYFGAQESNIRSLNFLRRHRKADSICIASNFNEIGMSNINLKHYALALQYYNQAIQFTNDDHFKMIILNNQALVFQKTKEYKKAIAIYNQIITQAPANTSDYALILSNLERTKWLQNPGYNAASKLLTALHIRQRAQNNWGMNASYAHLADFYTLKNPVLALSYSQKMLQIATKLKSADDQLEALQKLIKLSNSNTAKQYFDTYMRLSDSTQNARNAAKNQFAIIRYETEKSKSDNLKLQQENTEKQFQIIKREILLVAAILVFIGLAVIAVLWYKKRQQKMELEKQNAVQENQLKNAKKIHDVVANGLYRIMSEMDNQPHMDRELIIDKIENLYEKSRDISYEDVHQTDTPYQEKIASLLKSFATDETNIAIVGNSEELWANIQPNTFYEIEHILQELMVNMRKHSKATKVAVRFEKQPDKTNIFYTDNGIGLSKATKFNNGLQNTGNRIASINGLINFDTEVERGLKIELSFPTA